MTGHSVLAGVLLVIGSKSAAAVPDGNAAKQVEGFSVSPRSCIVKQGELCRAKFVFSWTLPGSGEVCIFRAGNGDPLFCSNSAVSGQVALELALEKTTRFDISVDRGSMSTTTSLATASVEVLVVGHHVRVRRRHLWSFL
ncbi:DUF3019 domain-containing protein [Microbulbifer elongatus]|uniref:DUF3019 domain-containing protein n=1 Tax=Microbulbifer elongatus TaxID=86173 RepID=A0ABT1NW84_9GAMM|nr:DUF3019 domain-containing protein [Microbulbifer elongatus]MCQ3828163.1 DUF3019 domain-containing protein [Microbulbifer elongatus]